MKKLLLILILFCSVGYGQIPASDTVRIVKHGYIAIFSKSLRYPIWVHWIDTKNSVKCAGQLPRVNNFHADQLQESNNLHDYLNSGFDKGHNKPAQDSECDGVQAETDCFSMINMTPEYHALNGGSWYHLE